MSKFATKFNHSQSALRLSRVSRCRSEFASDCDIRTIIKRHSMLPPCEPRYIDCTVIPDGVQGVLEFARRVAADFDSLPQPARERFNYDSSALVAFLLDEGNRDEAVRLGLIAPTPTPAPTPTEVKNDEK